MDWTETGARETTRLVAGTRRRFAAPASVVADNSVLVTATVWRGGATRYVSGATGVDAARMLSRAG